MSSVGDRVEHNDDGTIDEVVLGPGVWLHAEEMDRGKKGRRDFFVSLGDNMFNVRISGDGTKKYVYPFEGPIREQLDAGVRALAGVAELHVASEYNICEECRKPWPCPTSELVG